MGRFLSALLLGDHHAGVARAPFGSISSGRLNSAGISFQSTGGLTSEGLRVDASRRGHRNADREEVRRGSHNHDGIVVRAAFEYSTGHSVPEIGRAHV